MSLKRKIKNLKTKLSQHYKLSLLNEDTYEEDYNFRLNGFNLLTVVSIIVLVSVVITVLIIFISPLSKNLMSSNHSNAYYEKQSKDLHNKVESLEEELKNNQKYLEDLKLILSGGTPKQNLDTVVKSVPDSVGIPQNETSLSLNTLKSPIPIDVRGIDKLYLTPLKGVQTSQFNRLENHFGIDIAGKTGTPITSVADGKVIFSDWTSNTGYVVIVQHNKNTVSVYKHNLQVYKKSGAWVRAGEVIATVGNTGELTTGPHLHFELWIDSQPVDPKKYINF